VKPLVGVLLLIGGVLQGLAFFVRGNGYRMWDYLETAVRLDDGFVDSAQSLLSLLPYLLGGVLLTSAGVAYLVRPHRPVAAFGAGVAILSVAVWSSMATGYDGSDFGLAWNGILACLGGGAALAGGIVAWVMPAEGARAGVAQAGWYPDPSGGGRRWWDGTAWTTHTQP